MAFLPVKRMDGIAGTVNPGLPETPHRFYLRLLRSSRFCGRIGALLVYSAGTIKAINHEADEATGAIVSIPLAIDSFALAINDR